MIKFEEYFSNLLKPPTRLGYVRDIYIYRSSIEVYPWVYLKKVVQYIVWYIFRYPECVGVRYGILKGVVSKGGDPEFFI